MAPENPPASWWRLNATLPNLITLARMALMVVFVVLLASHEDAWAITALAVAGTTDFLDGYLARRLDQTSELGRMLDPAADRLLTVAVVVGLAWRDIVPWWLVAVLLVRDAVMAVALLSLARRRLPTPVVTFLGKSATAALYVFLPLSYLAFDRWDGLHTFALWGAAAAAVAYWGSAVQYLAQARRAGSDGVLTP
ncbi:MAG: CDP-alcohol phosphatidyltransferase family protein [Demequina sp.]|nr:CDP-alcohol phosphatidyltransferase family protein [Demequina sp.]